MKLHSFRGTQNRDDYCIYQVDDTGYHFELVTVNITDKIIQYTFPLKPMIEITDYQKNCYRL